MAEKEITQLLVRARSGEPELMGEVFKALYPELMRMARSRLRGRDATMTPTVLVHELFLRVTASEQLSLVDRRHFFAAAAQALRWIMVEEARRHLSQKRGGGAIHIELDEDLSPAAPAGSADTGVLALHEGLDALGEISPQRRQVVELRYFAGLEFKEVAELLEISERTAQREWERARAFLLAMLDGDADGP
ncbi:MULTISPECIES: ECF-type sigma factor [unclassified Luteimonas]